jgi:hypothetical protein
VRYYLYADESGNFDFSRGRGATRYFSVGTILLAGDDAVGELQRDLLALRTRLQWDGVAAGPSFHASEDRQAVRDEVFAVLGEHAFRTDVTLLEKSKAQPHLRASDPMLFQYAWYYHFKFLAPYVNGSGDELMVTAATIGTNRLRGAFRNAVESVVRQCAWRTAPRVVFAPTGSDPCLQAADYMLWAVMRQWERGDPRALDPLRSRISSQFDVFARGTAHYY